MPAGVSDAPAPEFDIRAGEVNARAGRTRRRPIRSAQPSRSVPLAEEVTTADHDCWNVELGCPSVELADMATGLTHPPNPSLHGLAARAGPGSGRRGRCGRCRPGVR